MEECFISSESPVSVVLASNNRKKIGELRSILVADIPGIEIHGLNDIGFTDEIEETGASLKENAQIKAEAAWIPGRICVADDSGLFVSALGGEPGIYSARYAGPECRDDMNIDKLLSSLDGIPDAERSAYFMTVIACKLADGEEFFVEGRCDGFIADSRRGSGGFGYDPVFICAETMLTFSQMGTPEKNQISHRAKACAAFAKELAKRLRRS